MMTEAGVHLLVIDPQQDFCDGPSNGALAVPGADADMRRLADLIRRSGQGIDAIHVTLDSHQLLDIAHPAWWRNAEGEPPAPFTVITAAAVAAGQWWAADPVHQERSEAYVRDLEQRGKYALVIWPPHCLIGSPGHAVHPDLFAALMTWQTLRQRPVNFILKGLNPYTEHYSAIAAEVPDPADPATLPNRALLGALERAGQVLVAGEALSHCVKATVTDIADMAGFDLCRRFTLLTDCMSPVPAIPGGLDFPAHGQAFLLEMQDRGMRLMTSGDLSF